MAAAGNRLGPTVLRIYRVSDGTRLLNRLVMAQATGLAIRDDGLLAVTYKRGFLRLLSVTQPEVIRRLDELTKPAFQSFPVGVAFSPDGSYLFAATRGVPGEDPGDLSVWSVEREKQILHVPLSVNPTSLHLAPDGRTLLIGTYQGVAELWDVK